MLGLLVFNEHNELVHVDGNDAFRVHLLRQTVDVGGVGGVRRETSSTSSGCFSLESRSPLRRKLGTTNGVTFCDFDAAQLAQYFLPLVVMCRVREDADDFYKVITCSNLRIILRPLPQHTLLVVFASSKLPEALVERFADDVTSAIFFHFGALLAFIGSDVTPVRQAKRVFERNIRQLTLACPRNIAEHEEIEQFNAIKGYDGKISNERRKFVNVDATVLLQEQVRSISTHLRTIANLAYNFLHSHRCILFLDLNIIASINVSNAIPLLEAFSSSELFFLVDGDEGSASYNDGDKSRQPSVKYEQVWIREGREQRSPCDVFRVRLGRRLQLVFLAESDGASLIRLMRRLSTLTDRLHFVQPVTEIASAVDFFLPMACSKLCDLITDEANEASGAFLRNASRTASFLQELWQRLRTRLLIYETRRSAASKMSLGLRLRQSLSLLNLLPRPDEEVTVASGMPLPADLDALLTHFRRQLCNITQELCARAVHLARGYKQDLLEQRVLHLLDLPRMGDSLRVEPSISSILDPSSMQLNMMAYHFSVPSKNASLSFIPETLQAVCRRYEDAWGTVNGWYKFLHFDDGQGKSSTSYLVTKMTDSNPTPTTRRLSFGRRRRSATDKHCCSQTLAVFPASIHPQLALSESRRLSFLLRNFVQKLSLQ